MLNESEIQKPTKFHAPHCRRSGSTVIILDLARGLPGRSCYRPGFKSKLCNINWALVKPGSDDTANLFAKYASLEFSSLSMAAAMYFDFWFCRDLRTSEVFGFRLWTLRLTVWSLNEGSGS